MRFLNLEKKVYLTVKKQQLIHPNDHILVAVSGGADSIGLLKILVKIAQKIHLQLTVVHFNHALRTAAEEEQQFVEALCQELCLTCIIKRWSKPPKKKQGIQEKAREWRLQQLLDLQVSLAATAIATAHHADDDWETIWLKILRGCHLSQIKGMKYRQQNFVRPLLDIPKIEIIRYLRETQQNWREDESNQSHDYARNRIRLDLIPLLNAMTQNSWMIHMRRWIEQAQELSDWVAGELANVAADLPSVKTSRGIEIDLKPLQQIPRFLQKEFLHQWLNNTLSIQIDYDHLEQIVKLIDCNTPHWEWMLPDDWRLKRNRAKLILAKKL